MDIQPCVPMGYRELTATELDLIDRIKTHAAQAEALVNELQVYLGAQAPRISTMTQFAAPHRWLNIGTTDLQLGFMALVRAVAQPTTF